MKSKLIATTAVATVMVSGAAYAASAKFAADWADGTVDLAAISQVNNGTSGPGVLGSAELLASIHIPQNKEALIGVSGVANLITFTEAKGKNEGGEVTAEAEATMDLEVRLADSDFGATAGDICAGDYDHYVAAPGPLTFASRIQTLTVDVDLDVAGSTTSGSIVGYVEVGLKNNTTAAHHFNFVAADLPSDTYDVVACFTGEAFATISGDADGGSNANAAVAIQHRMLTVQEVRAVKGSIESSVLVVD